MQTKSSLRQHYLELRQSLSTKERLHASRMICRQAEQRIDWRTIQAAHIYTAVSSLGEVDTSFLIDYIAAEVPHVRVSSSSAMPDAPFPAEQFDLIIVPIVAFDAQCHRIGMGGGWYDQFLTSQPQALTIGFAYSVQSCEAVPREPHDRSLAALCTDSAYYAR